MVKEINCCSGCGDDEVGITKDSYYGWICKQCFDDFERIDRETDWDKWEEDKRRRIAEANEY
jgi:hypothetical protein